MRLSYLCVAIAAFSFLAGCGHDQPAPPPPGTVVVSPPVTTPAPPAGPLISFGDGKYEIGNTIGDIAPGKYKTSGPMGGGNAAENKTCYWARLKDFTGSVMSFNATQYGNHGPDVVTIEPADKGFETRACGTWTRVAP